MEQFSLEKYLENPSRKVITKDGRVVKILDTEFESGNGNKSVLAKCIYNNKAAVYVYTTDGKANNIGETENDLFFADEEEKPQSIEELLSIIALQEIEYWRTHDKIIRQDFSERAKQILDLARKELTKNLPQKNDPIFELLEIFGEWLEKNGYSFKFPKSDTLKDLPKWKDVSGKNGAGTKDYKIVGYYLVKGNYAIYLEDLEKLPKE